MSTKRKFSWDVWDYDLDGDSYVIAKDSVPEKDKVLEFVCQEEGINPADKPQMTIDEGWCKWQTRSYWYEDDAPHGGYVVERQKEAPTRMDGKKQAGWFPVWLVRIEDWRC